MHDDDGLDDPDWLGWAARGLAIIAGVLAAVCVCALIRYLEGR